VTVARVAATDDAGVRWREVVELVEKLKDMRERILRRSGRMDSGGDYDLLLALDARVLRCEKVAALLAADRRAEAAAAVAARGKLLACLEHWEKRWEAVPLTPEVVDQELQWRWGLLEMERFLAVDRMERARARENFFDGLRRMRERHGAEMHEEGLEFWMIKALEDNASGDGR
jgi:hypothetical protein